MVERKETNIDQTATKRGFHMVSASQASGET